MGSATPTPTVAGGTIDNESLRRQKEEMGQALSRAQRTNSKIHQVNGSTSVPSSAAVSVRRSISVLTEPQDTIMADSNGIGTPQSSNAPPLKSSQTPAPAQLPTPVMEVDQALTAPLTNGVNGHDQSIPPPSRQGMFTTSQSENPLERHFRDTGKGMSCIGAVLYMLFLI